MNFVDAHQYDGRNTLYARSNESIAQWDEALGDIKVDNVAGIASGGEVSYFAMLPRANKRMVMIDHSYGSLYYALAKYALIEKMTCKEVHALFTTEGVTAIGKALEGVDVPLPPERTPKSVIKQYAVYDWRWAGQSLHTCWRHIPEEKVTHLKRNRHKIEFIHGDINDLVDRGQFDLLYLSNALDYVGRNGNGSKFELDKIVAPGGFVAYSFQDDGYSYNPHGSVAHRSSYQKIKDWPIVSTVHASPGAFADGILWWTHEIRQRPA